ncbi:DUF7343 domain-containing protein [Sulfuracidifex tepidarius]|uniref:DUF7343 domain-containing protein n=1 Tax=Sulfuracidifex tepidarius TaxID=1294262 RepID=A0A510DUS7_9CREN|nr:winged helix-turn-helix transcriptional regulator [Sulfuracidifex tepidarius]BBG23927.1 hypothetical protein IC006_1225 [Sulfuracidifex tepidarius]BBG26682.1 hypothetical protein IC007_1200 [Sulfuracidifex tepidarius]
MSSKKLILSILRENGGYLPQSRLKEITGLSKSRLSEILSELEKEGEISREKIIGRNLSVSLRNSLRIGIINAAEYPFIIPFYKKVKEKGYNPKLEVYSDGVSLTKDLVLGKLEVVMSPLVTQIFFNRIFGNITILSGGAKGGGGIVGENCGKVGSTFISSMEAWTLEYCKEADIVHMRSPTELIEKLDRKEVDAVAIWEPYLTLLKSRGIKVNYFEHEHCCTLAIRKDVTKAEEIKRIYEESFSEFLSSKERWISDYSNFLNFDHNVLSDAVKTYEFDSYLDPKEMQKNRKISISLKN